MNAAETIYNRLYTRYFSPGDKVFNCGAIIDYMDDIPASKEAKIQRINEYLNQGYKVRSGYTTTGIRGYYDRILIITK